MGWSAANRGGAAVTCLETVWRHHLSFFAVFALYGVSILVSKLCRELRFVAEQSAKAHMRFPLAHGAAWIAAIGRVTGEVTTLDQAIDGYRRYYPQFRSDPTSIPEWVLGHERLQGKPVEVPRQAIMKQLVVERWLPWLATKKEREVQP